ncbi:hypothetical protein Vadar_027143 [Vaccinium darrowii]|uniref:Uncharacterized protein n=1 Tax=Vaccinium darrowii TaxID=229202 RepID=A0ACB7XUB3_9ERIC|nr:hypothetical protein Vadar_027143 [Vaccinium darrowii]
MSKIFLRAVPREKRTRSSRGVMMDGIKPSPARPRPESSKPVDIRRVLGATGEPKKKVIVDEKLRRIREAEKAEKILHLICWGPFN